MLPRGGQHFPSFQLPVCGYFANFLLLIPSKNFPPKQAGMKIQLLPAKGSLSITSPPGAKENARILIKDLVLETSKHVFLV
jgi:hypothetical protein